MGEAKLLKMERETGFEPATSSLGSWHSTTELLPPVFNSNTGWPRSENADILSGHPSEYRWPRWHFDCTPVGGTNGTGTFKLDVATSSPVWRLSSDW